MVFLELLPIVVIVIACVLTARAWLDSLALSRRAHLPPATGPVDALLRWVDLLRGDSLPRELQPRRRQILRALLAGLACFVLAAILYAVIGGEA